MKWEVEKRVESTATTLTRLGPFVDSNSEQSIDSFSESLPRSELLIQVWDGSKFANVLYKRAQASCF